MGMKKCKAVIGVLLLVSLVVISVGGFFMDENNVMHVYASNEGMGSGGTEKPEEEPEEGMGKEPEEEPGEKPEGGGTISGNEIGDVSCICMDKCTANRINEECIVCAEDYEKCEYITPRVRISISRPDKWHRYGSAEVKVGVEDMAHSLDFVLEKVEARIGQNGSYTDITDTLKVRITEDCSVYVAVTDTRGRVYEENRSIQCFDKEKPSLNAGISGGMLTVQAADNTSGVKAVYVNGQEFTELTNGTLHIRLQEADSVYENFAIQAMDNAGNVSDVYNLKNPYYQNAEGKNEENSGNRLPESVLPTQTAEAKASVTDYVNTADKGNMDVENKEESKAETAGTEIAAVSSVSASESSNESSGRDKKEFYTIQTDSGKVFYLIIDNTKSDNNVYFLTEISENDLLHVTGTDYQTMGQSHAVVESALPDKEPEKEAEEKMESTETEEKENDMETETEDAGGKQNPALAWAVLILLAGAVAGGIYFFRTYRREGEDFIDDDEEDEDEEIYEREENGEDYGSGNLNNGLDDGMGEEGAVFYDEDTDDFREDDE